MSLSSPAPALSSIRAREAGATIPPPLAAEPGEQGGGVHDSDTLAQIRLLSAQIERALADGGRADAAQRLAYETAIAQGRTEERIEDVAAQMIEHRRETAEVLGRMSVSIERMAEQLGKLSERTRMERTVYLLAALTLGGWCGVQLLDRILGGG